MGNIGVQERIISEFWKTRKEIEIKELSKNIGLTIKQIHNAIPHLKRRGFISKIIKKRTNDKVGYQNPPKYEISIRPRMENSTQLRNFERIIERSNRM